MKISTKGRYALRLLIDLAQHNDSGFITLKDIAARQNISKKYLEQIVPILTKSQMVQSNRGFQGGYKLSKSPDQICVYDVLVATEGNLSCVAFNGLAHSALDIPVEIVEHNAKVFGEGFADRCLAGAHVSYDDD